jgi:hypothetical protein
MYHRDIKLKGRNYDKTSKRTVHAIDRPASHLETDTAKLEVNLQEVKGKLLSAKEPLQLNVKEDYSVHLVRFDKGTYFVFANLDNTLDFDFESFRTQDVKILNTFSFCDDDDFKASHSFVFPINTKAKPSDLSKDRFSLLFKTTFALAFKIIRCNGILAVTAEYCGLWARYDLERIAQNALDVYIFMSFMNEEP